MIVNPPLCDAHAHLSLYSRMQRCGAIGAGVDDERHHRTERRLLVRVALPFRRGRVTDASTRAA